MTSDRSLPGKPVRAVNPAQRGAESATHATQTPHDARAERLEAALRANLRKRKGQSRARPLPTGDDHGDAGQ